MFEEVQVYILKCFTIKYGYTYYHNKSNEKSFLTYLTFVYDKLVNPMFSSCIAAS